MVMEILFSAGIFFVVQVMACVDPIVQLSPVCGEVMAISGAADDWRYCPQAYIPPPTTIIAPMSATTSRKGGVLKEGVMCIVWSVL